MQAGTYTKGEFIALCRKAVEKRTSLDNQIFPSYINAYAAAAINYALIKQYYIDYKEYNGFADINPAFLGIYEDVEVQFNERRKKYYLTMPSRLVPMDIHKSVPYIGPMHNEANEFIWITQQDLFNLGNDLTLVTNDVFCMLEGMTVILINLPDAVKTVLIKKLVTMMDLKDDDYVPIPAGMEIDVINMIVEFFIGVRKLPEDKKPDNRDIE